MAQASQLGSLPFPSTTSLFHHELSTSFLSPLSALSLSTRYVKPTSLSLRLSSSLLHPILCSSSTIVTETQNPQEEISTTRLLAQNVPWTSTADDIRALFQKHGTVIDVEMSMHSKTRNRGLAFVEMGSAEEAAQALSKLEAYEFEGRTLKLNYARPKKKITSPSVQPKPSVLYNLFVANLSFEARSKDLKEFFQTNGANVVSADVIFLDDPRRPSGYGFVSFKTKKEADEALSTFQGKELMGRPIRVARSKRFVKLETEMKVESEKNEDMSAISDDDSEQPEAVNNS